MWFFRKNYLILSLVFAFGSTSSMDLKAEAHLVFRNSVMNVTKVHAKVTAGYVSIENLGTQDEVLISVKTDFAQISEIHEMKHVNGIMKMRKVTSGLTIKPKNTVHLEKGGFHLMFMKMSKHLSPDDIVSVDLKFRDAGWITVDFLVVDRHIASGSAHSHSQDDQ